VTAEPAELRDQLRVLKRRRTPILAVAGVAVVVAVAIGLLQSPTYTSSCDLLVVTQRSDPVFGFSLDQSPDPERVLQSSVALLESAQIRAEVTRRAGPGPLVSARAQPHSNVVRVTVTTGDPARAALLAETYARVFIDDRIRQASESLATASSKLQPRIDELQSRIDTVAEEADRLPPEQRAASVSSLQSRRDALISEQVLLKQRQTELEVASSIQDGNARVINPPVVPSSAASPAPLLNAAMGLGLGLVAGVALAMILDHLDDSIHDVGDVRRLETGVPVLAEIPRSTTDRRTGPGGRQPGVLAAADAYAQLRTSVLAAAGERPLRLLQVTSPSPGEGKTTTVANLGVAFAGIGLRVVVVCLDLRRPALHDAFGLSREVGFSSAMDGKVSLSGALQPVPGHDRLTLLAAGRTPADPTAMLASAQTDRILTMLAERHDLVLIDSPPLLPVADASVVASRMDGVLVVAAAGSTARQELLDGLAMLDQVRGRVLGLVLNGGRRAVPLRPSDPGRADPLRPAAQFTSATEKVSGY